MSINSLGYQALGNKQYSKADAFFEMNIANYPNSNNVYDSYGDFFAVKKDTANAIVYYQKALAIKEVDDTKYKLNQLQGREAFNLSEQDLQKYIGVYVFDGVSATATLSVKDNSLWASVPGEGDFELVPVSPNTFRLKSLEGYKVVFEMNGDKPAGFTSYQPNGTYKATYKKD